MRIGRYTFPDNGMIVPYFALHCLIDCYTSLKRHDRTVFWEEMMMTERLGNIAEQVRDRRKALRLTQDDLADLAGCSPRFIRALEAGKSTVRMDKLLDVLDALGLELAAGRRSTP